MEDNIYGPFEMFGVECGNGWKTLYEPIISYINDYNDGKSNEEKIHILQIKEKFGGLRIYVSYQTEELCKMIEDAEEESYKICETCGSKEDVGMVVGGWMYTTCFDCLVKSVKKKERPFLWHSNSDGKKYWVYGDGHKEEFAENLS